jgi:ribosomal-protein-alanine N-acetyltransferase
MAKTLIRSAARGDFAALLAIDQTCFPRGIAYDAEELAWFISRPGAHTLLLEDEGGIAAFLIFELRRKRATMITLDVREEHRRRGYATLLLERSEAMLQELAAERYELQVDVGNTAAIAFYLRHGFRTLRTLPRYYANGHDAFLMVKTLQPGAAGLP